MNEFEKPNFTKKAKELGIHRDTVRAYYNGKVTKTRVTKSQKLKSTK